MNVNLLPWRKQRLQKKGIQFLLLGCGSLIITLILIIFLHVLLVAHNHNAVLYYAELQSKILVRSRHNTITTKAQPSLHTVVVLNTIERERNTILPGLRTIAQSLPPTCYLTRLHYHGSWLMQGSAPNLHSISELLSRLKNYPRFHHVVLSNIVSQKKQKTFIYRIHII